MRAQRLLRFSLLLLMMAGCAAQPSALSTAVPPVVTTRVPALATPDITQSPSPAVSDYTAGWETFTSSRGYRLKYPPQLILEKRQDGLHVLLQDKNPLSVVFSMDERGLVTLAAMRDQATANFVNPTFTDIQMPGARGFVIEGKLGPGYGEGEYAKTAYYYNEK